ncbi:elongation factor Ts, mitochondrial isoform X1 [Phalacrocorax carbo]|uniref:elongation factor Ts, mitochondrial isoform X1 n=1 Tax=Phalacrocorax carbo TaxID=9209 RepID=UPI00311A2CC5
MQRAALRAAGAARVAPPARFFRPAPPALAADKEALLELRRRTGLSFVQCREGLLRCGGDLRQAEAWLQEEAQRRGWSKAGQVRGRRTPAGLVGLLRGGPAATMVEVNCETDFVARNAEFQQLVEAAALGAMAHCRAAPAPPGPCATHLLEAEELAQLRTEPGGALLSDRFAVAIAPPTKAGPQFSGKLGENVVLRRAAWLRVPEEDGYIAAYAHGGLPVGEGPVAMGTYGALVGCGVAQPRPPETELEEVGRKVAQHVVGLAPTSLGTPEELPHSGTQGEEEEEEETRLLAQRFLLEPSLTVGQFLQARGALAVRGFLRFSCGEEGPGTAG